MFDRFTDQARLVMGGAREGALAFGSTTIDERHVLWGLLGDQADGIAGVVLTNLGADRAVIVAELRTAFGDAAPIEGAGAVPFTEGAKTVLEHSRDEAMGFGHDYIGDEHLLLALLSVSQDIPSPTFQGIDFEAAREEVRRVLGS